VNIVGEAKSQNGQRPVNLIGTAQASEYARRLIMEIVESDTNGGPPGPPVRAPPSQQHFGGSAEGGRLSETIRVPIDAVGMIIGKGTACPLHFTSTTKTDCDPEGGETIKEMQNSTGCRINVSSQFNPNDQEREISLAGNREAIARARAAIDEKVEASVPSPSSPPVN
jgi:far upstream element-binding protein